MDNKENELDFFGLIRSVWKKRRYVIKWGAIGLVVGVIIAYSIPKEYVSSIEIVLENNNKSNTGSMGTLAGMMGVNIGGTTQDGVTEQIYPKVIESTPFLSEFAEIPIVYKDQTIPLWKYMFDYQKKPWWSYVISAPSTFMGWIRSFGSEKKVIDSLNTPELVRSFSGTLKSKLNLTVDKTNIYKVTVTMQDARVSKQVADSAMVFLNQYMTKYKTAKSKDKLEQNIIALEKARHRYYIADSLYAASADRNQNLVSKATQIKIERLQNERDLAFTIYQQLSTQVEMDRIKLNEDMPIGTVIEPSFEPTDASKPNRLLIMVAYLVLGVIGSAGVVIVRELIKKPAPEINNVI